MQTVREAREGLGLSQAELARRSGLSLGTVWRAENSGQPLNEETAELLARALCRDTSQLFTPNQLSVRGRPPRSGCPKAKSATSLHVMCSSCRIDTNASLDRCTNCDQRLEH